MDRWSNKVAVVTGASSGIGAAIAKKLVEEGLVVVGLARRKDRIEELAKSLEGQHEGKLYALKVDLTVQEEIISAFRWVVENLGPVHILVNNGGTGQSTTLINGDIDGWRRVLDTNFMGLAIATREAVNIMMNNAIDGHVININSVMGHRVPNIPYGNVYPASKHAVTAFSETLKQELFAAGTKIKTTSVSPGYVETEILSHNGFESNEVVQKIREMVPRMYPVDVANAVAYVLSTPPHVQITELMLQPLGEMV